MEHALVKPVVLPELPDCLVDPGYRPRLTAADVRLRRAIVDSMELWTYCGNGACRKAGRCRSRKVACFDRERPFVVDHMTGFVHDGYTALEGEPILGDIVD